MSNLASNMRILREIHGKTVEEVAGKIGCDKALLSRIERGLLKKPDPSYITRFCELFYVDEELLIAKPLVLPVQIASE